MQEVLGVVYPSIFGAADNLALLLNDEFIDGSSEGAASPTVFGPMMDLFILMAGKRHFFKTASVDKTINPFFSPNFLRCLMTKMGHMPKNNFYQQCKS